MGPRLRAGNERSVRIGRWLAESDPPGEELVTAEDRARFIEFLEEYATSLTSPPLGRWEVLGTIRRSSTSMQTFVATDSETVRLTWTADDLRLVGWGLGGETPGAFAAGVGADEGLTAYMPGIDTKVPIRAVRRRGERVDEIEVGGVTATRASRGQAGQ